jgi:hypothetical protein
LAANVSGGSAVSLSVTDAAFVVTVHASPSPNGVVGVSVNVVGPPEVVKAFAAPSQTSVNAPAAAVTASLKVIVIAAF